MSVSLQSSLSHVLQHVRLGEWNKAAFLVDRQFESAATSRAVWSMVASTCIEEENESGAIRAMEGALQQVIAGQLRKMGLGAAHDRVYREGDLQGKIKPFFQSHAKSCYDDIMNEQGSEIQVQARIKAVDRRIFKEFSSVQTAQAFLDLCPGNQIVLNPPRSQEKSAT